MIGPGCEALLRPSATRLGRENTKCSASQNLRVAAKRGERANGFRGDTIRGLSHA